MTYLYIDPGTGSMLFTILLGVITAGIYGAKNLFIKLKFKMSGASKDAAANNGDRIPYAILTDDKRYWTVFKPICDEFEKRGTKLVYYTASADDPALKEEYKNVECIFSGEGNKSYARWNMLKADVVLSTTPSLDVYQWKRSKDCRFYVHIPHAASDITLYRMFGIDYYDALLLSGEFQERQIRRLEELRNLPQKEIRLVGLPQFDEMKKKLEKEPKPARKKKKTVLLAPSWGPSAIFSRFGGAVIDALLKTNYDIIIRPHPQSFSSEKELMDELMARYPDGDRISWNRDTDNFGVLNKADLLISDFSGVLFDFAMVFDKPIIYTDTSFDKGPYDAAWLDEELWTFEILPKLGEQLKEAELDNIGDIIRGCLSNKRYADGRELARQQCWCNIGGAAKAVVDYLEGSFEDSGVKAPE